MATEGCSSDIKISFISYVRMKMTALFVTREIDVLFSGNCSESMKLRHPFPP